MNRYIFIFVLLFISLVMRAEFTSTDVYKTSKDFGIDLNVEHFELLFFDKSQVLLTYQFAQSATFKWYQYTENASSKVNIYTESNVSSSTINVTDFNKGYVVEIEYWDSNLKKMVTVTETVWLMNVEEDLVTLTDMNLSSENYCENLTVSFNVFANDLYYRQPNGTKRNLERIVELEYTTLSWTGTEYKDSTVVNTQKLTVTNKTVEKNFTVAAPYRNTYFTATTDQFLKAFHKEQKLATATEYQAVAITAHPTAEVIERDAKNERDRKTESPFGGSGALVVDFKSNANVPVTKYFEWFISNSDNALNYSYYTDEAFRYTFKNSGQYVSKLRVSNEVCSSDTLTTKVDSLNITVGESQLEVPNVFTPNGDGINDEFRVAYKSLASFRMVVYSRWGRKVYESSDPSKGWNGTINGKKALTGPYYYFIEATGTDTKNGERVKYKLTGDINLLRGKD